MQKINPFKFSTSHEDSDEEILRVKFFGYRYYHSPSGTWLNRDLVAEFGGVNIYGFVGNSPITRHDVLGLCECSRDDVNRMGYLASLLAAIMSKAIEGTTLIDERGIESVIVSREFGGRICCNQSSGHVIYTPPEPGPLKKEPRMDSYTGNETNLLESMPYSVFGADWVDAGYYHSHPEASLFSRGDIRVLNFNFNGLPLFVSIVGVNRVFRVDPRQIPDTNSNLLPWADLNEVKDKGGEIPTVFPHPDLNPGLTWPIPVYPLR